MTLEARPVASTTGEPGTVKDGAFAGGAGIAETVDLGIVAEDVVRANALARYRLLGEIRPLSLPRTASCRRKRVSHTVQVQLRPDGGYQLAGCETCGSVWGCPCCAAKIYSERAREVQQALRLWQDDPKHVAAMLTLTVRHHWGDSLRRMRKGVSHAWRLMWQGKAAREIRDRLGIAHYIRSIEITHGRNGWHPHLHVLILGTRKLDQFHEEELAERWQRCVLRALGLEAKPDKTHGCQLTDHFEDNYIEKLGLEITEIENKRGKRGSQTPWSIAHAAGAGDGRARKLWTTYVHEMKGTRQLTWSRGTKDCFGIREISDDELAADGAEVIEGVGGVMAEWSGSDWDTCCREYRDWTTRVIAAAASATPITNLRSLPRCKETVPPNIVFRPLQCTPARVAPALV